MRYALLIYCNQDTAACDHDRQRRPEQFTAIRDGLRAHGVVTHTQLLLLSSAAARVVRRWAGGDIIVTSGPAAHTREQLTGWVIAECQDPDAAVRLATTIPAAWHGSVEVRPAGQTLT